MTQEDKLKEAKRLYQTANADQKYVLESLFHELKESEDERVRKFLIGYFDKLIDENSEWGLIKETREKIITWLEKQGEHAKFRDSIQVGDKVTRNQDGVIVNLSQLKRVAKPVEPQQDMLPQEKYAKAVDECIYGEKSEWSEEDEQYLLVCKNALAKYQVSDKWDATIISRWLENRLKSLRPQFSSYHEGFKNGFEKAKQMHYDYWKPSDAQMESITCAVRKMKESACYDSELVSLLNDLKKLKE